MALYLVVGLVYISSLPTLRSLGLVSPPLATAAQFPQGPRRAIWPAAARPTPRAADAGASDAAGAAKAKTDAGASPAAAVAADPTNPHDAPSAAFSNSVAPLQLQAE